MEQKINSVFLDHTFEKQLVKVIIGSKNNDGSRDCRYGEKIIKFLKDIYFSSKYMKMIVNIIIKHNEKYNTIPTYNEIKGWLAGMVELSDIDRDAVIELLKVISNTNLSSNQKFIEDSAFNFFVQQEIMFFTKTISTNIRNEGIKDFERFMYNLNELNKKFHGTLRPIELNDNALKYLETPDGEYIPLGWGDSIDHAINFRQGSLLLAMAPTGVGKTTATIVTAVHNFLRGKKVCVIFFEDEYSDLFKKVFAKLSGIPINDLTLSDANRDYVKSMAKLKMEEAEKRGGNLTFIKKSAVDTTTNDIKNIIDSYISEQGKLDLLIIDYIDCLKSASGKIYKDPYAEETDVIMEVLDMGSDLNYFIPILTFTQSNRSAVNKSFFSEEDIGGSYGKAKKAPQLIAIAKSVEDKVNQTATITILKNRKGNAGLKYIGGTYDNSRLIIEFTEENVETITKK